MENNKLTEFEKFREFINDDENELIIRIMVIVFGTVLGIFLILLSSLFNGSILVAFQIFGYLSVIGTWLSILIWAL